MANNNVRFFKVALQATFDNLVSKDAQALYWIEETSRLYCGETLYGTGALATEQAAGLLSPEDYAELKRLIATGGQTGLSPVDGSLTIADGKIGVRVSKATDNLIAITSDGLFAAVDLQPIEQRLTAVEAQTVGGIRYKGSVATTEDLPTTATQGDLYEVEADGSEWCYNGEKWFEYGASHLRPVAGDGIVINDNTIAVRFAPTTNGLVAVDGALSIDLATTTSAGAMSAADKKKIDSIPYAYVARKYDISGTPNGTLVNYGDREIRIMCPANAEFAKQNVGAGGDANTYYMTFKTYAPSDDAVGYIEHLGDQSDSEILTVFSTDEYGRRYQQTWLGIAKYDEATGAWNYYGANSSVDKYIGWDYRIDWYDADGVMIFTDSVRINLSNDSCHHIFKPYYMNEVITTTEAEEIRATVATMEQAYSWTDM